MPSVTWQLREDIADAYKTIQSNSKASMRDFRLPETAATDFERWLEHNIPYVNYSFELVRDWYDQSEHKYLRAQQTPIDWKSKIGNSDMSTNFKTTHEYPIFKGDMVIREDGTVYLLNWEVQNHVNNQATQSAECNARCEFIRHVPDKTDNRGMQIVPAHKEIIAPSIPIIHSEYAGRPDYVSSQGTPGVAADHLISLYLQWNSTTKNIRIDDEFELGIFTYRVINISISEVNIEQDHGVLTLNAKRVAGGGIVDE